MDETNKEIPSFCIEVCVDNSGKHQKVTISPEKEKNNWHRERLDRKKDGLLAPEIIKDMEKIAINLCKQNEKGQYVGKYSNFYMINLPANPKSSKSSKQEYSSYIKEFIVKKGDDKKIAEFRGKRVLVYICVYLRKSRYEKGNDVDNFAKNVLDSLKEYLGDDSQVDNLIIEKKLLPNYPEEDLDFLEQVIVAITDPEAKVDILK